MGCVQDQSRRASRLVSVFSFDFENYNSRRKTAAQKMNTIRLRDNGSSICHSLCGARATKIMSNGGKNREKTVFKGFSLAGNTMHLGSRWKVEGDRIIFVFLMRRFSFFKKHFSMILKKLMPIRSDPTSVNQPEEKLDIRDCSLIASVSCYLLQK
jgi:hypothetical protein